MTKKMANKPGYKNSELGWIPDEWEVKKMKNVVEINSDTLTERNDSNYTFYYIDLSCVNKGNISFPKSKLNFKNAPSRARRIVKKDNILMSTVRPNLLGFAYFDKMETNYIASTGFAVLESKTSSNPRFIYQLLFSKIIIDQIGNLVVGSNYPALNNSDIENLAIPLPPLQEQKKIAEILSTWDKAIEKTEKLIEAITKLKKGLMQKLLTGKLRLRGFKSTWNECQLNDIFERVTRRNSEKNTNVVTISAQRGFVRQEDFFNKIVASDILDEYFLVYRGEFCYNKSYSKGYDWGATKRLNDFEKAVVTTLYICFKLKYESEHSGDFFEHFFEANILNEGLTQIAHEGGRAHGLLNVTPHDFFNLSISIPELQEQKAIASVLNGITKELNLHNSKLSALKEQKKGLMQKLLTGEVRVKI